MADTFDPTGPQKRAGSTPDHRSRLDALTRTLEARDLADTPDRWPEALSPGSGLGPYRIVRLLGQGGMGVVYEAEEIETARRVALKVLSAERRGDVDRERFLREGRLAASLNHPHCVFVFGAWEIDGDLVISMELMRETLADRLEHTGRLPFAVAVDVILQVNAGLEAAAAAGILHRDVKPSNCFVDEQNRIKIGDFGISISALTTSAKGAATGHRIVGTPGFASPEQLRGDDVDLRTDIYGVGATLYQLVTGQPIFDKPDLMALLMAVANENPAAPHHLDRTIPRGLSRIILRCLSKKPERRFASHAALALALQRYSSSLPRTASPGRRVVASLFDHVLLLPAFFSLLIVSGFPPEIETARQLAIFTVGGSVWRALYFAVSEGVWGASIGKACAGIRVASADGLQAGFGRVVCRSVLFVLSFDLIHLITLLAAPEFPLTAPGGALGFFFRFEVRLAIALAVLFCTARRRNRFAGIHDLVTGTRVVERRSLARPAAAASVTDAALRAPITRVGPYDLVAPSIDGMPPEWSLGFDPLLARAVWIRAASGDAPAVSPARRAVNRSTRLRWLAGRRAATGAWDAYSAAPGLPLLDACRTPRPWAEVRWWLLSLAQECLTARRELASPPLRPERVRVASGGLASLVDDPPHDTERASPDADASRATGEFLSQVATLAMGRSHAEPEGTGARSREPLPVGAERLLRELAGSPPVDERHVVSSLEQLVNRPAGMTWRLRLLPIAACVLPAVLSGLNASMTMWQGDPVPARWNDVRIAAASLRAIDQAEREQTRLTTQLRDALEILLASRYRAWLEEPERFQRSGRGLSLSGNYGELRRRVLRTYPRVDPGRLDDAEKVATSFIAEVLREPTPPPSGWMIPYSQVGVLWPFALAGIAISLVFRGGLIRTAGLAIVTVDGRAATRGRLLIRSLLMWSPILIAGLIQSSELGVQVLPGVVSLAAIATVAGGAIHSLLRPARGLHDRMTGVWVVPR